MSGSKLTLCFSLLVLACALASEREPTPDLSRYAKTKGFQCRANASKCPPVVRPTVYLYLLTFRRPGLKPPTGGAQ